MLVQAFQFDFQPSYSIYVDFKSDFPPNLLFRFSPTILTKMFELDFDIKKCKRKCWLRPKPLLIGIYQNPR